MLVIVETAIIHCGTMLINILANIEANIRGAKRNDVLLIVTERFNARNIE